jgi:hypothetical protein
MVAPDPPIVRAPELEQVEFVCISALILTVPDPLTWMAPHAISLRASNPNGSEKFAMFPATAIVETRCVVAPITPVKNDPRVPPSTTSM